jgi:hypothetical protein
MCGVKPSAQQAFTIFWSARASSNISDTIMLRGSRGVRPGFIQVGQRGAGRNILAMETEPPLDRQHVRRNRKAVSATGVYVRSCTDQHFRLSDTNNYVEGNWGGMPGVRPDLAVEEIGDLLQPPLRQPELAAHGAIVRHRRCNAGWGALGVIECACRVLVLLVDGVGAVDGVRGRGHLAGARVLAARHGGGGGDGSSARRGAVRG